MREGYEYTKHPFAAGRWASGCPGPSVRRELGSKWKTLVVVIGQCVIAWLAALVVYQTALVLL